MADTDRDDVQSLLGAYALDAVDGPERDLVERHLDTDPRARAEVASFREVAAMLAMTGTDAPEGVWDRIVAGIEGADADAAAAPPRLQILSDGDRTERDDGERTPTRPGVAWRWIALAAAAALLVVAVLGAEVVRQNDRIDKLEATSSGDRLRHRAEVAATQPGSRTVSLTSTGGDEVASIVLRADGTGFFLPRDLTSADAGDVYQLWALVGDPADPDAISAGVLGRDPGVVPFRFSGPVHGFAVTQEQSPGVVSSRQSPQATGLLGA